MLLRRFICLSAVAAACVSSTTVTQSAAADDVKVFLLGGQSNMDGRADADDLPAALKSPQSDVLFYYRGNTSLTTLRPGSGTDFGPEVTFGRTIADGLPTENFALIKHAVSGTSLFDDWDPNTAGNTYSNFRDTVTDGLTALTTAGHTYEIVGMLWTQGERDRGAGRTTAQYESDLNEFIADIRIRYGTDLPFFFNRLSSGLSENEENGLANVRAAQENVAAGDPLAYMIDSDDIALKSDNLHFSAAGQVALGEAFGQAYLETVPEPGSLVLLGLGGLAVLRRRRT